MNCRICKGTKLETFLELGDQPHCNSFLSEDELNEPEASWPLNLVYCSDCHLVQLSCVVDPDVMFKDYVYVSGTTKTLTAHFRKTASELVKRFETKPGALAVDIGSNDGTFLEAFKEAGMSPLGVDPATNIADEANALGRETINDYFTQEVAQKIVEERGHASVVTACGVFFHIDDLDDVCRGVHTLIGADGLLHVQAMYAGWMLENQSYDVVYHEHVSYYTLLSLSNLFPRFGLEIFDVEFSEIHGGSILLYVAREGEREVSPNVERILAEERAKGWDTIAPYHALAERVKANREALVKLIKERKAAGRRIAAYAAPARGNTVLNYCGLGREFLDYAAEKAPLKIGLYTPGTHLPVVDEAEAMEDPPDDFLLLAWTFQDELLEKNSEFRAQGGKFIIPLPEPVVV